MQACPPERVCIECHVIVIVTVTRRGSTLTGRWRRRGGDEGRRNAGVRNVGAACPCHPVSRPTSPEDGGGGEDVLGVTNVFTNVGGGWWEFRYRPQGPAPSPVICTRTVHAEGRKQGSSFRRARSNSNLNSEAHPSA